MLIEETSSAKMADGDSKWLRMDRSHDAELAAAGFEGQVLGEELSRNAARNGLALAVVYATPR